MTAATLRRRGLALSTNDGDCQNCGRHTDGHLCSRCLGTLVKTLGELPALLHELEVAVTRQDRLDASTMPVYGRREDVASAEYRLIPPRLRSLHGRIALPSTPWAYGPDAAAMLLDARLDLARWVRHLKHARGLVGTDLAGAVCERCSHTSCVRIRLRRGSIGHRAVDVRLTLWLIRHRAELAQDDLAGELMANLTWHRNRVETQIDRRDPEVFLGCCDADDVKVDATAYDDTETVMLIVRPSECGVELYAHLDDKTIVCPACGWSYNVVARKAKLLELVYDEIRPVFDVANAVTGLFTDDRDEAVICTPDMIHRFKREGRLSYRGTAADGKSQLVKVSDVIELLRSGMERDRERRARRPRRVSA